MRTRKRVAPDLSINIKAPSKLLTEGQAKELLRRHIKTAEGHTDLKLRSGASATVIWRAALSNWHVFSTPIPHSICVALGFSRVRAYRWTNADK